MLKRLKSDDSEVVCHCGCRRTLHMQGKKGSLDLLALVFESGDACASEYSRITVPASIQIVDSIRA